MGEAADDILDGSTCQCCGVWMDDILHGEEPPGYPRTCRFCKRQERDFKPQPVMDKVGCSICHKRVKAAGLHDHMRAVHSKLLDAQAKP